MASRIVPPATAFRATSRRTKRVRIKSDGYLDFIRSIPCLVTGSTVDVQAAHVSFEDLRWGKLGRGRGTKEDDCWAVPLCREMHERQHGSDERAFWAARNIKVLRVATCLWRCWQTNDYETALIVIQHARDP